MVLKEAINIALKYLGEELFLKLSIKLVLSEDSSLLKVNRNNDSIVITYGQVTSIFYALSIIKQHYDEVCFEYTFNRILTKSGLMLDCSRNGVLRVDKVKEMILLHALLGNNRLLLYTEDTYSLSKYPYFGYLRGRYSKEELISIVEYGESFGIEIVPCIQTLGHLYHVLKWEPMAHLKDGSSTLMVGDEKVYSFIEDMISFSREIFKSHDIHIGMDESFEMGLGKSFHKFGYQDRVKMFSSHLLRVIDICKKYDFKPMIWSDMYFRLNSSDEEYYRDTSLPSSTIELIPNDVKLVYWDYYHDSVDIYDKMISFHKDTNNEIVFAGGAWRWKGYCPAIRTSLNYTKLAFESCLKNNVLDTFITAWGDDGSECPMFSIVPLIAQSGYLSFNKEYDETSLSNLIKVVTGLSLNDFLLFDLPDMPEGRTLAPTYNPSKYFLYQDVLLGLFDLQVKDEFATNYDKYAKVLKDKSKEANQYGYIFNLLSCLCKVLSKKVDLGKKLRKAYKDKNINLLKKYYDSYDEIESALLLFENSLKESWDKEFKRFGYEVIDGRLGFLKNRIKTSKETLLSYLEGHITFIEEFEEDILPYDGREDETSWNYWLRNVSPSN